MKYNIKLLTLAYLGFLVFNLVSGFFDGAVAELIFALAFAVPVCAVVVALSKRSENFSLYEYLGMGSDSATLLLALGAPTVAAVAGLSYLTATLIYVTTGQTNVINVGDSYFEALVSYAVLPAVLEEALFRYLPMKTLLKYSPRVCVLLSAVMFAAAHRSLFQLGYAFVAGAVFMIIDIGSGSVLPSLALHFINNLISLTVIFYGGNIAVITALNVIICLLLVLSLAVFVWKRKTVVGKIKESFAGGEPMGFDPTPLFFIIPTVVLAISEIV